MRALRLLGRIFLFLASTSASVHSAHGAVISSCDQAGLETAVASGGNFAFACDATITLTSTLNISNHLVLDGTGHNIVINGNNAVRLFQVAPGAYLELVNLSLVNGRYVGTKGVNGANGTQAQPGESANGGAILVQNGNVLLTSCILSNNSVLGGVGGSYSGPDMLGAKSGGAGNGGAICVINGELSATGCVFARNWAMGATGGNTFKDLSFAPPGSSYGGAVCNVGGNLKLTNNVFVSNLSTGSLAVLNTFNYGPAGAAYGGAIHSEGGQASLIGSSFVSNVAGGGFVAVNGGSVGNGNGGGLSVTNGAILVRLCSFEKNRALGGNAGRFAGVGKGFGGAIFNQGTIDVSDTTLSGNSAITGRSANAGFESAGGGVYNAGRGTFNRCLLVENLTLGGLANSIQGGGGNGGDGLGGGIYNLSMLLMTNSTLMKNVAQGQNGTFNMYNVRGQGGAGKGGALCNAGGEAVLMNVTIVTNKILNGIGITNGAGAGGGIYSTNGTVTLLNTIVAHSPSGSN
ncbi:MAG: hypothetical protein JWM16_2403, partial [Verrucomicrobiales bacterium]|nr:hypothetical protein [Verrucomicrobiales bacterium]